MSKHQELSAASYLVLKDDGKVLLMKRKNTGFKDGHWSLVAGHVDRGENFREAMVREAREEAGIEISQKDLRPFSVMHRDSRESPYVDLFFLCEEWSGEIVNREPEKCEKLEWFEIDDLPEKTIGFVEKALLESGTNLEYQEYGWEK